MPSTGVRRRQTSGVILSHFPETFNVKFLGVNFHDTTDPGLAIAEFRSSGSAVTTGKPYEQTRISVVYTDDRGRITHYVDFWNPLVAMEALESGTSA